MFIVNDKNILTSELVLNIMLNHFHSGPEDVICTVKQLAKEKKQ